MVRRTLCLLLLMVAVCVRVAADEEASNAPHVAIDQFGRCYAKSVPLESYGSAGSTSVYAVERGQDRLIDSYAWYSKEIYLQCYTQMPDGRSATSVVQLGPWARGQKASRGDLALAFYAGGALLRRYSTLDIAGSPDRVSASVSHYRVIARVDGYVPNGSRSAFAIVTEDGRSLLFDPATGVLVQTIAEPVRGSGVAPVR